MFILFVSDRVMEPRVSILDDRNGTQEDCRKIERWAKTNKMKRNRAEYKVLCLGWKN